MLTRRLLATAAALSLLAGPMAARSVAAATPTRVYVALGDSYSSGEGACKPVSATACSYLAGSATRADSCHRSHNAYPARVSLTLPRTWKFVFAACSGAFTADVLTAGQYGEPSQLSALLQQKTAGNIVKLVTLTIGGNDAGFAQAVGSCVTAHDFLGSSCHGKVTFAISTALLRTRLAAVYAAIHGAAPEARLFVLGYPRLFSPTPSASAPCDLAAVDARTFGKAEDTLNAAIVATVKRADAIAGVTFASYVDNSAVFNGHQLCAGPAATSDLNALLLTSAGVRSESFHPNRVGQSLLAKRLEKALKK